MVRAPGILAGPLPGRTRGVTGAVYRSIRGATSLVGVAIDALIEPPAPGTGSVREDPRVARLLGAGRAVVLDPV